MTHSPHPRLVINGDDLGLSERVNSETFKLMDNGMMTSASLMANAPFALDALRRYHEFPNCSFGIHLNLTDFKPLSKGSGIFRFLNSEGEFHKGMLSISQISRTEESALFDELRTQVEFCLKLGGAPSHLDSHHHIHLIPCFKPIFQEVAQSFKITCLRGSKFNIADPTDLRRPFHPFVSLDFLKSWLQTAVKINEPILELPLHPGGTNPKYQAEIQEVEKLLKKYPTQPFTLSSFLIPPVNLSLGLICPS